VIPPSFVATSRLMVDEMESTTTWVVKPKVQLRVALVSPFLRCLICLSLVDLPVNPCRREIVHYLGHNHS
jgi:hypothetical protein